VTFSLENLLRSGVTFSPVIDSPFRKNLLFFPRFFVKNKTTIAEGKEKLNATIDQPDIRGLGTA
jgi:hypothetical protein